MTFANPVRINREIGTLHSLALPENRHDTDQLFRLPGISLPLERLDKRNAGLYAPFVDGKSFGQALRRRREKAGIKQRDLARIAGIPASTLSALENKGQGMNKRIFVRLCRLLGADPKKVADEAYYDFRKSLGEEADELIDRQEEGEAAKNAIPSIDEIVELYDAAEATRRSLFLALLRLLRPDKAVTAFLEDRFRELEPALNSPRTRSGPKGRTPWRPRGRG